MAELRRVPEYAQCFGRYRAQSVTYALANCLECPKLKACVRTTWGVDQPRRWRSGSYQPAGNKGTAAGRRPSRVSEMAAT